MSVNLLTEKDTIVGFTSSPDCNWYLDFAPSDPVPLTVNGSTNLYGIGDLIGNGDPSVEFSVQGEYQFKYRCDQCDTLVDESFLQIDYLTQPNDECLGAIALIAPSGPGLITTNSNLIFSACVTHTLVPAYPANWLGNLYGDIWFKFISSPGTNNFQFTILGLSLAKLALYDDDCASLNLIGSWVSTGATLVTPNVFLAGNVVYYLRVSSNNPTIPQTFTINITES